MKCPYCGVVMRATGERRSPSKNVQEHNAWKCRRAGQRRQRAMNTQAMAEAKVLAKAKQGLEYLVERQARGKKWFRSQHAAELEAAGLPPNCEVAAIVLGVNLATVKKRLANGIDLLKPLRADSRNGRGSSVRLRVLFPEFAEKIVIYNPSEKRRLKRKLAKVRKEAAVLDEMEV